MPNDRDVEATVAGFAVLAVISFVGIVATIGWVAVVSLGILRDDKGASINVSHVGLGGVVPGKVARIARQSTGFHSV
jgi:hypothetical protein